MLRVAGRIVLVAAPKCRGDGETGISPLARHLRGWGTKAGRHPVNQISRPVLSLKLDPQTTTSESHHHPLDTTRPSCNLLLPSSSQSSPRLRLSSHRPRHSKLRRRHRPRPRHRPWAVPVRPSSTSATDGPRSKTMACLRRRSGSNAGDWRARCRLKLWLSTPDSRTAVPRTPCNSLKSSTAKVLPSRPRLDSKATGKGCVEPTDKSWCPSRRGLCCCSKGRRRSSMRATDSNHEHTRIKFTTRACSASFGVGW